MAQDTQDCTSVSLNFARRICKANGISPAANIPPNLRIGDNTIEGARQEFEFVCFDLIESLLKKNNLSPQNIDILVTNCSILNPVPSLSAMIVNKFKMREDIKSFSLGGMGCSASACSVEIAQALLKTNRNLKSKYALVVSTENLTAGVYPGKNRSMLLADSLFRAGCAVILLTNKPSQKNKYVLKEIVRTHTGKYEGAYKCIYMMTDDEDMRAVSLDKSITANALKALQNNMITVFLHHVHINCLIKYVFSLCFQQIKYYYETRIQHIAQPHPMPFMPNIKTSFQHMCFHTGGKAVLDSMQRMFNLSDEKMEASRGALFHYGNTSSASTWYGLSYEESQRRIKKGNIVWQISFGSGFKCNSIIWKALKNIEDDKDISWFDIYNKNYKVTREMYTQPNFSEEELNYRFEDQDIRNIERMISKCQKKMNQLQEELNLAKQTQEQYQQQIEQQQKQ